MLSIMITLGTENFFEGIAGGTDGMDEDASIRVFAESMKKALCEFFPDVTVEVLTDRLSARTFVTLTEDANANSDTFCVERESGGNDTVSHLCAYIQDVRAELWAEQNFWRIKGNE